MELESSRGGVVSLGYEIPSDPTFKVLLSRTEQVDIVMRNE